jgi:hypothetical protein
MVRVAVTAGIFDVLDTSSFKHTKFIVSTCPSCLVFHQLIVIVDK